jgi:hypothetical protein
VNFKRDMMIIYWEHIGNKEEKQKIIPPTPPLKGKKHGPS